MDRTEFWQQKHRAFDTYWLTGSRASEYSKLYSVGFAPHLEVTEIGVGTGAAVLDMVHLGCVVRAVDISVEALERVSVHVDTYRVDELAQVPPADLAFCHLVAQHVDRDMLQHIMEAVRLKPYGVLCLQTAWMTDPPRGLAEDMHGLVWHPPEEVTEIARKTGLEIVEERRMVFSCKGDEVHWSLFRLVRSP